MPFTEKDLRAMLEDNSSDLPPTGDLAASAQERGRRVRRRRQAAGAVAAAALVAVGIAVVPLLGADDEGRQEVLASSTSGSRPDVDLSALPKNEIPWSFFHQIGEVAISDSPAPQPTDVQVSTETGAFVYRGAGPLKSHSIVGTVEGFSKAPDSVAPAENGSSVQLEVRLGNQIDDPSRLEKRGLREGEVVTLWAGYVDTKGDPTGSLQRAVPKGTRVVAFERPLATVSDTVEKIRRIHSVVFEDADGTPVAGPYFQNPPTGEWKEAKTFDMVLKLAQKASYKCATLALAKPASPEEKDRLLKELSEKPGEDGAPAKERCLRIDPSAIPLIKVDPTATPVPSPTSPEDPAATPTPSPTLS